MCWSEIKEQSSDSINNNRLSFFQTASLISIQTISDYIEDKALHSVVLVKVKTLLEKNQSDVKIISLILGFFEKILVRLDRNHILEQVIPTLLSMRLSDPDIINRVVSKYIVPLKIGAFRMVQMSGAFDVQ